MTPRQIGWYVVSAMALLAILLMNSDRRILQAPDDTVEKLTNSPNSTTLPIHSRSHNKIHRIAIIGERSSGTRWLYGHIGECFNNTVEVKRYLTRYKHWFQYENATKYPHDTLVLAQFRNPYDWFQAMLVVPHHSPSHIKLKWQEFLTRPWTTERVGIDLNISEDSMCQEDFRYNEIVSCVTEPRPKSFWDGKKIRYSEHQPFYEMRQDGSGQPFNSIMELRAAKIRNFLEVRNYEGIADLWAIQYEYLLKEGTQHLLDKIEEWTGAQRNCQPYPPQHRRKRGISLGMAQFLNDNLDWVAEGLVGYKKETL